MVHGAAVGPVMGVFEHVRVLIARPSSARARVRLEGLGPRCKRAQDRRGDDGASAQRGGEPTDFAPIAGDEPCVDAVASQPVQRAVVGVAVDAPQSLVGQVGQSRCPPVGPVPRPGRSRSRRRRRCRWSSSRAGCRSGWQAARRGHAGCRVGCRASASGRTRYRCRPSTSTAWSLIAGRTSAGCRQR